jgi:steroid delta-isomerase-like uncharacterized protein
MSQATIDLLNRYYAAFNAGDMNAFLELLDDNVVHDINQGGSQTGKDVFKKFMEHMNHCYKETISNLVIMSDSEGNHAATKFMVEGKYLETDNGFTPAKGQTYKLPAGGFFEIKNGKISRVTTYYNLQDWLNQVKG